MAKGSWITSSFSIDRANTLSTSRFLREAIVELQPSKENPGAYGLGAVLGDNGGALAQSLRLL